jgi:hypothetical protein
VLFLAAIPLGLEARLSAKNKTFINASSVFLRLNT